MNVIVLGASQGIGQAICERLSTDDSINLFRTTSNIESFETKRGDDHLFYCDLGNEQSIESLKIRLKEKVTFIDCLINCAGVLHTSDFQPEKSLNQLNQNRFLTSFQINTIGHLLVLKALQSLLRKSQNGVAVSLSARIGSIEDNHLGGWYSYRMSKAALNMGFKTLNVEWKRTSPHLKLLLIHPGTTDTNLSKPFQKNLKKGQLQTAEQTAGLIWEQVLKARSQSQTNLFIDFKGRKIPW